MIGGRARRRAADDVDVVDEQLDVAGLTADPRDQRDRSADRHQDRELRPGGVLVRSEQGRKAMQGGDVRRADEPAEDADDHGRGAEPFPEPDRRGAQDLAQGWWSHINIVSRYVSWGQLTK